ncbi:MAG: D-glycerate dehydrogenase [Thermoprotei archaeon]|nr:MAG: D-glycerate dehydrogenase [Thermoprotei archaeon]
MKPKLFITRQLPGKAIEKLREYYDVEVWPHYPPPPRDVLLNKAEEADALATLLTDKIDCELISNAPKLRIIAQYAVGYDNIDVKCATRYGVYVTNTPGVLTETVADHTWALILAISRRILESDDYVRKGEWHRSGTGWHPMMMLGYDVHGKTLGIIGLGRIGSAVARRARGFNMKILYYDHRRKPELEKELRVKYVPLDTLLREADIVSLHVPLTKETYHMIGEKELRLMKKTAFLINTARGAVVDTKALIKALKEGWIAGAALDVHEQEPLPPNHPLYQFKNVILTPHTGSASWETRIKMADIVAENLMAFAKGEIPPTLVNKEVIKVRKPGFK